jgi:hypothetical protein
MSKRLVKLIIISDFVSPPPAAQTHINSPASCIRVSAFPRPARGVLSPITSFRTLSGSARTFLYLLRSNTDHSCSTPPLPPSPRIRTNSFGGKLVERDGMQANLWLQNEAKLWASICESRLHSVPAVLCLGGLVVRAVVKEPARAVLVAQTPHDLSRPYYPTCFEGMVS